jgi:hypothetical protein
MRCSGTVRGYQGVLLNCGPLAHKSFRLRNSRSTRSFLLGALVAIAPLSIVITIKYNANVSETTIHELVDLLR